MLAPRGSLEALQRLPEPTKGSLEAPGGPRETPRGSLELNLASFWGYLGPTWGQVEGIWGHLGSYVGLCWGMLRYVDASYGQLVACMQIFRRFGGSKLELSWAILRLCCPILGPKAFRSSLEALQKLLEALQRLSGGKFIAQGVGKSSPKAPDAPQG